MKISDLISYLIKPLVYISIGIIIIAFLLHFNDNFVNLKYGWIIRKFDIRRENNVAVWFESNLFLLVALSFVPLGFSKELKTEFNKFVKFFFQISVFGFVFLALDEMISVHEYLGKFVENRTGITEGTNIEEVGFGWILIYAPIVFVGSFFVWSIWSKLLKELDGKSYKVGKKFVILIIIGAISTVLMEVVEGFFWFENKVDTIFPCFEEGIEFMTLISFLVCNNILIKGFEKE